MNTKKGSDPSRHGGRATGDEGSFALILGGSKGLGLATAMKLARHGYNIIVVHRDRRADLPVIKTAFHEIESFGIQFISYNMDATNPESRRKMLMDMRRKLSGKKKIRVLVHSIAKGNLKPLHSKGNKALDYQDFMITMNAMAISLFDWTKALVKEKLFARDTRIISFTSEGNSKVLPNYAAVSVAKAGLEAITRSIAVEFAPFGIKANCIQAGVTITESFKMIPQSEKIAAAALKRNPSGRLTRPEDVANVVYLLCTDEAEWITGTIIAVDGGERLQ